MNDILPIHLCADGTIAVTVDGGTHYLTRAEALDLADELITTALLSCDAEEAATVRQ